MSTTSMMFVFSGAFQLYDTDKSDSISKDEMHKIVTVKGIIYAV